MITRTQIAGTLPQMIVWLASFPRSGNTFFRIVSHKIFDINTYSGFQSGNSDLERVGIGDITGHNRLPIVLESGLRTNDESIWRPYHESSEIYLIKTHARKDELLAANLPTILLARDGRDAYVSLAWYWITVAHAWRLESSSLKSRSMVRLEQVAKALGLKKFLFRRVLDQLVKGTRWADFNESWLAEKHPAMSILHFNNLISDPIQSVYAALHNVGAVAARSGSADLPNFENLHRQYPQFFRKGDRGGWRKEMNGSQLDWFWTSNGATMESLGYDTSDRAM